VSPDCADFSPIAAPEAANVIKIGIIAKKVGPMLEVREIKKNYEGRALLHGISFQLSAGETICLLGPSGSGKSTLLRIIAGIEPAESGQVLWDGRDLSGVPAHKRGFGLMFQDYALFPHLNVAENVAFGLRMQGLARPEIQARVDAAWPRGQAC
jgi:spermidine/putrescine transport system ATP-binding protein